MPNEARARMSDEEAKERIELVIRGTTDDARRALIQLLLDAETARVNFDGICQTPEICLEAMPASRLVKLRHQIAYSLVPPETQAQADEYSHSSG